MAIKLSTNLEKQKEEITVMKSIRKHYKKHNDRAKSFPIPQVISNGVFEMDVRDIDNNIENTKVCFYVMK